jgi:hypothetical protein
VCLPEVVSGLFDPPEDVGVVDGIAGVAGVEDVGVVEVVADDDSEAEAAWVEAPVVAVFA